MGWCFKVWFCWEKKLHSTLQGTAQKNESHVHTINLRWSVSFFWLWTWSLPTKVLTLWDWRCLPCGIGGPNSALWKNQAHPLQGGFIYCTQENCAPDLFAATPEAGSSNPAADLAALLGMQRATESQLFSGGQNPAVLNLKENWILMRRTRWKLLKLGSLSLSFENVDHGAKSIEGGSAPAHRATLGRAPGSLCSPCSICSTRIWSLPSSLRF